MGTKIRSSQQLLIDDHLDFNSKKGINLLAGTAAGHAVNKGQMEQAIKDAIPYDIDFEFADFVLGTAKTYTLDIKAKVAYTIEGVILETDAGSLTAVDIKINSTAVTGLSGLSAETTMAEYSSTAAKSVSLSDRVYLIIGTGHTGTPTLIRGKLIRKLS